MVGASGTTKLWVKSQISAVDPERSTKAQARNAQDDLDIAYFGKKQKLKRTFGFIPIIGLSCSIMVTWQAVLLNFASPFLNGGPLGMVCGYILTWVGVTSQALVMAEMGSMIPLAGGQYNWVSVLAPERYSKFMSYATGWFTAIQWQLAFTSGLYICAGTIQGMAILNNPEYSSTRWQATLIGYGILAASVFINTVGIRALPLLETSILVVHILGFIGILIPLIYLGPKGNTEDVFGTFIQDGGYSSKGVTLLVGASTTLFNMIGVDAAAHIAEEIEGASEVIPKAMILATNINGLCGFGMLIGILFVLGDPDAVLNTPTGSPFIEIVKNIVRSNASTEIIVLIVLLALLFSTLGAMATTSRMIWAFAREQAVPGHKWLSQIHCATRLPLFALAVSGIIGMLLLLINIGSTTAFNAFTNTSVAAFLSSYMLAAGCMLYRRLTDSLHVRWGPFKLGRAGVPLILFSLAYSLMMFIFAFFPPSPNPTAVTFNWSLVVYCGALIIGLVYWFVAARHQYTGPKVETTVDELQLHEHIHVA